MIKVHYIYCALLIYATADLTGGTRVRPGGWGHLPYVVKDGQQFRAFSLL